VRPAKLFTAHQSLIVAEVGKLNREAIDRIIAAVILHHTPKINHRGDTSDWKPSDWQYGGAGAAVLTNWARAVLVIDPTDVAGIYRFIAAKRTQRLGWKTGDQYFAHSREGRLL